MTRLTMYQVDAFTRQVFRGNPAAVVPLSEWLPDDVMQAVASENNLAETAFFVPMGDGTYRLRWFTPAQEVPLCGHATLASAFVLFTELTPEAVSVAFQTQSGTLRVARAGDGRLTLDFPARPTAPVVPPPGLLPALIPGEGAPPQEVRAGEGDTNLYAVFARESEVRALRPDMGALAALCPHGVCVTAPADDSGVDFVSRYFAPSYGIPEDPVTGSTHCALVPYWAARLGKSTLEARQVSPRGGELWCEDQGDRVHISGHAVLYLRGEIGYEKETGPNHEVIGAGAKR